MSYGIESKKLKKLVSYYSPFNNGEEIKFLTLFKGDEGVIRYLETSPFQGIDETSVQQRVAWFGSNHPIQPQSTNSLIHVLLAPLREFWMKLHLLFSLLALVLAFIRPSQTLMSSQIGGIINFAVLAVVYCLLVTPGVFKHFQNDKIRSYAQTGCRVKVWRDNQRKEVHSFDLVVGDIVELHKGDIVGADGLLIEGEVYVREAMGQKQVVVKKNTTRQCVQRWAYQPEDLKTSNYSLTNNQIELPSPIVLGGSEVVQGEARMVVLCVGKHSYVGYFFYQLQKCLGDRKSSIQQKISQLIFEISKYVLLTILIVVVLYIAKVVVFIILQKNLSTLDWRKTLLDLAEGLQLLLLGLPVFQVIGLALGAVCLKINIFRADNVWYKYAKDCGNMKDISSIVIDKIDEYVPVELVKWWNEDEETIEKEQMIQQLNSKFESTFIKSLRCEDFSPSEVGFEFVSFFIGMNSRNVSHLQRSLAEFARRREQFFQSHKDVILESQIQIEDSENSMIKDQPAKQAVENIFIKGNSETLIKQCTHILNKHTGNKVPLTERSREHILGLIWKMNALDMPSLITGYIEVNPNHPKFRESDYHVVMVSLIGYKENEDNAQFEALTRMRKAEIGITLTGSTGHDDTVSLAKELGIIILDKPSVRLRGYDFDRIVGGIICKACKKSMCICADQSKHQPILKNQDEFNRIYKHLNVLSESTPVEKLSLAVGLSSAQQNCCFLGLNIHDVPAMKVSSVAAAVTSHMEDTYVQMAVDVLMPDNKLVTIQKMMQWSSFFHGFCRKYIVLSFTPCLTAFAASACSYLLYNNFCISLFQLCWFSAVICPILGVTFALGQPSTVDSIDTGPEKQKSILDRSSTRQISSQVVIQTIIILVVLVFGSSIIPEDRDSIDDVIGQDWAAKYATQDRSTVAPGISEDIFNYRQAQFIKVFTTYALHSRHLTFIFNLFMMMQFMNYFNCRKLSEKSFSFVDGITPAVILCVLLALGLQILAIFLGGDVFELYPLGLTLKQWAICLGLSLLVIVAGLVIKQVPEDTDSEENGRKVFPNRCYNLAVMAVAQRETLQDFEIDEEMEVRNMNLHE